VSIKRLILWWSHSVVTYPPLQSLQEWDVNIDKINYWDSTNLYIHIAFCETECSFCHYAVRFYRGKWRSKEWLIQKVEEYVSCLKKEIINWAKKLKETNTSISSIYIWWWTPLILEKEELWDIIDLIYSEFTIQEWVDFCIEWSPLSITAKDWTEKLEFLKSKWINRLSFWIQSFHDEVLKFSARWYKKETALDACAIVWNVFDNRNMDLIQWLYKWSPQEVWDNLEYINTIKPPHITWYHWRFAERPQKSWLLWARKDWFETEEDTIFGRMLIWKYLEKVWYTQIDWNRFVLDEKYIDPFKKTRTSVKNDLLWIWVSSYSHTSDYWDNWDWIFFRNIFNIEEYIKHMKDNPFAIWTSRVINNEEKLSASYAVWLRKARYDSDEIREIEGKDWKLNEMYKDKINEYRDLWLIDDIEWWIKLSKLGKLFEDEILSSFYSPTVFDYLDDTWNSF